MSRTRWDYRRRSTGELISHKRIQVSIGRDELIQGAALLVQDHRDEMPNAKDPALLTLEDVVSRYLDDCYSHGFVSMWEDRLDSNLAVAREVLELAEAVVSRTYGDKGERV